MFFRFSLLALFAFSTYAVCDEPVFSEQNAMRELFRSVRERCIRESGVNEQLLQNNGSEIFEVERTVKCFGACMMKAHGVMRADGTLNVELAIEQLDVDFLEKRKERLTQAFRNCATQQGEDDCETYHKITKCVRDYEDSIKE